MEENQKTTGQMLEDEIRKTLNELDDVRVFTDESVKPVLDKLRVLHNQYLDLQKLELDEAIRKCELELEMRKFETETALKIREAEFKEADSKKNRELEEAKLKEQKKSNTTNAIIGGMTVATGLLTIGSTLYCFKHGMMFEEHGAFTAKTAQHVGGIINMFRRR